MRWLTAAVAAGVLCLVACDKPKLSPGSKVPPPAPDQPAFPERQPVVAQPPVQTIPFEVGYEAGYARGEADGKPRAEIPAEQAVAAMAAEEAGADERRAEKWRNGWTSGYLDGFRKKATGAK